ncbi:YeeE/YedE family protein [Undibacterium sp. TJN25]|uniref:YeeE/YedE family protein n=1 Tax=Undibacterium sp. TJN25 TaxID=3413056 RepID=UPI003BF29B6C
MTIAWNSFTPYAALLGGALIGLAAALLMLFSGRIAGISGIVGGLFRPTDGQRGWRIAFMMGLVISPLAYQLFAALPESSVDASWPVLVIAGLLVGFGTRYGSGCTSGHGVCGLSRLSPRSLAATLLFMAAGFATVYVLRHLLGAA